MIITLYTGSLFVDEDHSHIVMDNLEIINNSELGTVFSNGPKYRENRIADY